MTKSYEQRRARERNKLQRMKEIREFIRLAKEPLSLSEIKKHFQNESERTLERNLSELVELENISYDEKEKLYWISNAELLNASGEQMKTLANIAEKEYLTPAVLSIVQLVKRLDPKTFGKMTDKRALSYMLDKVNNEILKKS